MTTAPIHDTVAAAIVRATEALRPKNLAASDARLASWVDAFEADIRAVAQPVLQKHIEADTTPPEVRDMLNAALNPEHLSQVTPLLAIAAALFYPIVSATMAGPAAGIAQGSMQDTVATIGSLNLTAAELALAKVRNQLGGLHFYQEMAANGYDHAHADVLALNTGEPISIEEALLLYRRGQLGAALGMTDDAALTHVIRQSRIRDEYITAVHDLQFAPPPAGEVISGALKGHLTDTDAQTKLGEAGIKPDNFAWMKATAGRPPGLEQMLHLWNRQVATETDVDDAVRQSDINDHYLPFVKELRKYFPPPRSVVPMLRSGSITEAQARTLLSYYGVDAEWVNAFIGEAHTTKTSTAKELTQSQVIRMYESQLLSRADATARLEALKMSPADVDLLLNYADESRAEKYTQAVVTRIHSRYVAWKIDDPAARAALAQDQIPAAAIDTLMPLWTIERDTNRPSLTTAELLGAYRRGFLSQTDLYTRLGNAGWNTADMPILVALAFPPTAFRTGPSPPVP